METKRKKLKILLIAVITVLAVAFVGGLLYLNKVKHYQKAVAALNYSTIDISKIADGEYTGECDVDMVFAKVEVTISDGKIADIKLLEHKQGQGKPAESIIETILLKQEIDVDTIAGATNSSKIIKKAVENACMQGLE